MTTYDPTCTQPGHWRRPPEAHAPDAEVLAYLRHCDVCEYHAMHNLEEDLSLDYLLREACRDLALDEVHPIPPFHAVATARRDRAAQPRVPAFRFERSLTQACIAAFSIVVLWVAFVGYRTAPAPPDAAVETPPEAVMAEALPSLSPHLLADKQEGRLYLSRIAEAPGLGRLATAEAALTATVPGLLPGSFLRVTNPANGRSVAVKVVAAAASDWEIALSASAAEALGLDGDAYLFVEILSEPRSDPAAFAP